jgi:LacI family transcriptional regulator
MLLMDTSRAYPRMLAKGILKYSKINGSWCFYRKYQSSVIPQVDFRHEQADGIISLEQLDKPFLEKMKLPVLFTGDHNLNLKKQVRIIGNEKKIEHLGADYLKGCCYRNFAFYGYGDRGTFRGHNFFNDLSVQGFFVDTFVKEETGGSMEIALAKKLKWIRSLPKPIGIMACNDENALEVAEICGMAGLSIPIEVGILGIDNDEYVCELTDPTISSVAINAENVGYKAAMCLNNLIEKGEPDIVDVVIEPLFVKTRFTTDCILAKDPEIAKVMQFITTNSKRNIGVEDVIKSTPLPRRTLHRKFKKTFSRTILAEIRRCRIEEIKRELLNSDKQIRRIAMELNYTSVDHISRYFKKETGISLREYRKGYSPL